MTDAQAIPAGFSTATPNLVVADGAAAIDFYERAFGAEVQRRLEAGGMLVHAALRIGDAIVTLCDAMPDHGFVAPATHVEDVSDEELARRMGGPGS